MKIRTVIAIMAIAFAVVSISITFIVIFAPQEKQDSEILKQEFNSYIETLAPYGFLDLVKGYEKLLIKDTIKGQVFGSSKLGEFLKIRSDAVIELEAWAETSYGISLSNDLWSIQWKDNKKYLSVNIPGLEARTPAILTDTIRANILDRSILVNEAKVIESMKSGLTESFNLYISEQLSNTEIRMKAEACLYDIIQKFTDKLHIKNIYIDIKIGN